MQMQHATIDQARTCHPVQTTKESKPNKQHRSSTPINKLILLLIPLLLRMLSVLLSLLLGLDTLLLCLRSLLLPDALELLELVLCLVLLRPKQVSNILQTLARDAQLSAQERLARAENALAITTRSLGVLVVVGIEDVGEGGGGIAVQSAKVGLLDGRDVLVDGSEGGVAETVELRCVGCDVAGGCCEVG